MKTLDRPESFFKKLFKNFFQAKKDAMLLVTNFATVANHCQISFASKGFVTV